ncbi:hypothetical protein BKA66DRAFT_456601 [Pyrenochaeta sp. MPI-SDFR-AT-0127]|nr:hypothetical protein BKA66DRAFT_456601 [Pyrenochaeta sp. MPI-SDFR-AT-0127]
MERVVSIRELLEQILLFVDQRSLLISVLRVSRLWYSLVSESPSLQRHLYFQPIISPQSVSINATPVLNPLLSWAFPNWFDGTRYPQRLDKNTGERFNPTGSISFFDAPIAEAYFALPWARNANAWSHREASWRRMEITHPSVRVLHVRSALDKYGHREDYTGTSIFNATDSTGHGLRMGDLYDFLVRKVANFHFSSDNDDWVRDEIGSMNQDQRPWTCESMVKPCKIQEGSWCMELHFYTLDTWSGVVDWDPNDSTFTSEAAGTALEVLCAEDGTPL